MARRRKTQWQDGPDYQTDATLRANMLGDTPDDGLNRRKCLSSDPIGTPNDPAYDNWALNSGLDSIRQASEENYLPPRFQDELVQQSLNRCRTQLQFFSPILRVLRVSVVFSRL